MQKYKYITLLFVVLFLVGCAKDDFITIGDSRGEKAVYGFGVGGGTTRTFINDDGVTISWDKDDKVALWAKKDNAFVLNNQEFNNWFITADNSQAYFTAKLENPMTAKDSNDNLITYQYYVTYPALPKESVNGTTCTFTLPSTQDGKMGGGADIMVAQGTGPALAKLYTPANPDDSNVVPDYVIDDGVKLQMKHLIHALRFYVPQGKWGFPQGETVERIVFTMPANVAGTVTADVAAESPALSSPTNATNTISLNLKEPIGPSAADAQGIVAYDFAVAAIMPATYNGDMTVRAYSQTKAAQYIISINSRDMQAAHVTPVGLNCSRTVDQYCLRFKYGGNNLGEPVTAIRINYKDENGASQVLTIPVEQFAKDGGIYDVDLTDWDFDDQFANLRTTLKNQVITVEYESEHALVSQTVNLPDVTQKGINESTLTVPYLFFEDFSSVTSFSSNDAYKTSSTGSMSAYSFLNGWTGARIGAQAGTSIRIASRRETSADYPARVDSAPLSGIKSGKTVNIKITYDYGVDYDGTHTGGQTILPGYVTSTEAYKSGGSIYVWKPLGTSYQDFSKISGTFAESDRFVVDGTDGSYTNTPETGSYTLYGRNNATRLTWAAVTLHEPGANNTTSWLYLDNIKVQIVK